MKRTGLILLTVILFNGCGGGARTQDPGTYNPGPSGRYYDPSKTPDEVTNWRTAELGTDKMRDPAKTIEWIKVSTTTGTRYVGGSVQVDRILRKDAKGLYGVDVRLKNRSDTPVDVEIRCVFRSREGESLLGLYDDWRNGKRVDWLKVSFDPLGYRSIMVSARMRHAVGFTLYVRPAGSEADGTPDAGVKDN